jgi:hypothetical protein
MTVYMKNHSNTRLKPTNHALREILQKSTDSLRGLNELRDVVKKHPMSARAHLELGASLGDLSVHFNNPDLVEDGIKELRVAGQLDTTSGIAQAEIGVLLMNAGRYKDARTELELNVIDYNKISIHHALILGCARMECEDYKGGLELFERVVAAKPDDAKALVEASHCSFLIGNEK